MYSLLSLGITGLLLVSTAFNFLLAAVVRFAKKLQTELEHPTSVVLVDCVSLTPPPLPSVFSPASKTLSIVVPAYNEEERLDATLNEVINYLQHRRNKQGPHFTYEIIVVDDGSKDKTVRVAVQYVERYGFDAVRILKVPKNQGKGHAVRRGMGCARGEVLLLMDADGATRVRDLELLEAMLTKVQRPPTVIDPTAAAAGPAAGMGVVYGSRSHLEKAAMARRSRLRNVLTWGFHLCVMLVAGGRVRDTQCGFKLFTRPAAALLFGNQRLQRWCFDVELLYLAEQMDVPVAEVPVSWTEMPGSKIRPTSILHMAYELLTIKAAYQWFGLWKVYCLPELKFLAAQHAARLAGADKAQ